MLTSRVQTFLAWPGHDYSSPCAFTNFSVGMSPPQAQAMPPCRSTVAPRAANTKACVCIGIELPILTSVETAHLEKSSSSQEYPWRSASHMGPPAGGSAEAPSPARVGALIRYPRQAGPWRHLADPEGAGVIEGGTGSSGVGRWSHSIKPTAWQKCWLPI